MSLIFDRIDKPFNSRTFMDYKKTEVYKSLKKSLNLKIIDKSIYWSIILDFSYEYQKLIFFLVDYYITEINIANPNIPKLLIQSYKKIDYYEITKTTPTYNSLELRNNLSFLVSIICFSDRSSLPKFIKFTKDNILEPNNYTKNISKLQYKSLEDVISFEDNVHIHIPLSEIDLSLSQIGNEFNRIENVIFWLSFILELENRYTEGLIKPRKIKDIDPKYQNDITWLIWKIIFRNSKSQNKPILEYLFDLYKHNFKKANKKKKHNILLFSILLIIDKNPKINYNTPVIPIPKDVLEVNIKINRLYNNIYKINEKKEPISHLSVQKPFVSKKKSRKLIDNKNLNKKTKIYIPLKKV